MNAPDSFDTNIAPHELDPERPRPVKTPWGVMALYVDRGEVLCVQAFCPHLDGPLFEGSVANGAVTCPWHMWRFDLRSGRRIGPFGAPWPGGDHVERCAVSLGARGTIVLAPLRA
jgi:nitrite reductase/ring-hydroxylating ferredoxin subunit